MENRKWYTVLIRFTKHRTASEIQDQAASPFRTKFIVPTAYRGGGLGLGPPLLSGNPFSSESQSPTERKGKAFRDL